MENSRIDLLIKSLLLAFLLAGATSCKGTPSKDTTGKEEISNSKNDETTGQARFGGLALYTVRDAMGTDAKATLQAVANAGYRHIEAAGYADGKFYNMPPDEFKALLKNLDLTPISSHQSTVTLDNAEDMMAHVKTAGFEYFVVPIPPMGLFNYDEEKKAMGMTGGAKNLAEILDALGKKANAAGLKLLYHNHDFEFVEGEDGIVPIDFLLENCNPDFVNFQMDLYWVTKAGADPLAYFEKYPGRFKIWHVKDMAENGNFAPVGKGTIDFSTILAQKDLSGMEYYFVEQDKTFTMEPLEAIKVSHQGIQKFGFE